MLHQVFKCLQHPIASIWRRRTVRMKGRLTKTAGYSSISPVCQEQCIESHTVTTFK